VQPRRQERTDGRPRTGARQHHPQAPQGQDRGLGLGPMGQVGADERGPCGDTGMTRHRDPPWGDGSNAISHTMPSRGMSCHLCNDVVPSFFKNLPQKGEGLPLCHERRDASGSVRHGPPRAGGAHRPIQRGLRDLHPQKARHVHPTNSGLPVLAETGSRAPDTWTGLRSPGRGDPHSAPVSADQGSIGLSRPGTG
jgi:hypothetical protein